MSKRLDKISNFRLDGLICAPCTPFKENGDVDVDIYDKYVQHLLGYGVYNIFAIGTTGECNNMTVEERKQVAEAWVKAGKGKLKAIFVHIGAANLRESQELARHAQEIGADAIACVGPTYFKPESVELYVDYMATVAAAAPDLPFYLYDVDFFTGINLNLNDFFRLGREKIPTLRGIKHTSPHFPSMNTLLTECQDMQILLGSDEMYLQALAIGMECTIMNSYQGVVLNRLVAAFNGGKIAEARKQQEYALKICNIHRKYDFSVPAGTKSTLNAIGFEVGQPRCPLQPVSSEVVASLKQDLADIGYFDWGVPSE